jgi:hypothetical protein
MLLGNGFQQWTFLCFRAMSLQAGNNPMPTSYSRCRLQTLNLTQSKQAEAYCWHSPAWLFLVLSPTGTHDHIFVLIYNPYGIRRWASSSVRGGVGLFNAAGLCQLLYHGLPLVCLLHVKEAAQIRSYHIASGWTA